MNIKKEKNCNMDLSSIPEGVSAEEWYAIDLSDPLMAIC